MTQLGFQLTGSGVKDCEGCGEHVMVSDLSKPAFCGDGECVNEGDCADCFSPLEDHCEECGECMCECDDDEDDDRCFECQSLVCDCPEN